MNPGDLVRVIAYHAVSHGHVGEVTRITYRVEFPDGSYGDYNAADLEAL